MKKLWLLLVAAILLLTAACSEKEETGNAANGEEAEAKVFKIGGIPGSKRFRFKSSF